MLSRPVLSLAHSPDPDDAFMWWPLFELEGREPRVISERFRYAPVTADIETLNERSETGDYEITAISCAQYARVAERYVLTACGSSMGDAYGPKLVARYCATLEDLRSSRATIAVPGTRTSAFAALNLLLGPGTFRFQAVPFDHIIEAVASGDFDAGVVIHEGQLTFASAGLHLVQDLGSWWTGQTGLPLPLGVNVVRRDLDELFGEGSLDQIADDLLRSVEYAIEHRTEGVEYAMHFARGMETSLADEFIGLYVNRLTLDFGERGRAAVETFFRACARAGLIEQAPNVASVSARRPRTLNQSLQP